MKSSSSSSSCPLLFLFFWSLVWGFPAWGLTREEADQPSTPESYVPVLISSLPSPGKTQDLAFGKWFMTHNYLENHGLPIDFDGLGSRLMTITREEFRTHELPELWKFTFMETRYMDSTEIEFSVNPSAPVFQDHRSAIFRVFAVPETKNYRTLTPMLALQYVEIVFAKLPFFEDPAILNSSVLAISERLKTEQFIHEYLVSSQEPFWLEGKVQSPEWRDRKISQIKFLDHSMMISIGQTIFIRQESCVVMRPMGVVFIVCFCLMVLARIAAVHLFPLVCSELDHLSYFIVYELIGEFVICLVLMFFQFKTGVFLLVVSFMGNGIALVPSCDPLRRRWVRGGFVSRGRSLLDHVFGDTLFIAAYEFLLLWTILARRFEFFWFYFFFSIVTMSLSTGNRQALFGYLILAVWPKTIMFLWGLQSEDNFFLQTPYGAWLSFLTVLSFLVQLVLSVDWNYELENRAVPQPQDVSLQHEMVIEDHSICLISKPKNPTAQSPELL